MKSLYSYKYNTEFYHIPKNAMTSTIRTLNLKWENDSEINIRKHVFCVLRNPLTRVVSSYLQIQEHYIKQNYKFNIRPLTKPSMKSIIYCHNLEKGFVCYLKEILDNGFFDSHNLPQSFYLDNRHKDIVGKNWISNRNINNITTFVSIDKLSEFFNKIKNENNERPISSRKLNAKNIYVINKLLKIAIDNKKTIEEIYKEDFTLYLKEIDTVFPTNISTEIKGFDFIWYLLFRLRHSIKLIGYTIYFRIIHNTKYA